MGALATRRVQISLGVPGEKVEALVKGETLGPVERGERPPRVDKEERAETEAQEGWVAQEEWVVWAGSQTPAASSGSTSSRAWGAFPG